MWDLWIRSKHLSVRPSELAGEEEPLAAFNLDNAVLTFGLALEQELEKAGHSPSKEEKKIEAARTRILRKWIPEAFKASTATGFRDPAKEM